MSDNTVDIYESEEDIPSLNFKVGTLEPDKWIPKVDYRDRDRMKVTFKLNKEETASFVNFKNQTKPDEISEDIFVKSIFFLGLSTLETNISKKITEELELLDKQVKLPDDDDDPVDEEKAD